MDITSQRAYIGAGIAVAFGYELLSLLQSLSSLSAIQVEIYACVRGLHRNRLLYLHLLQAVNTLAVEPCSASNFMVESMWNTAKVGLRSLIILLRFLRVSFLRRFRYLRYSVKLTFSLVICKSIP